MHITRLLIACLMGGSLVSGQAEAQSQTPASRVDVRATRISVTALPGFANTIVIASANGVVTIGDGAGGVTLGDPGSSGCTQLATTVTCPPPLRLRVKAGDGDDTIVNLTSIPMLAKGGSGNDIIIGGSAGDTLIGDSGDDILMGGDGPDDLRGSSGDDVIIGGGGADRINGQGGFDTVSYPDPLVWPAVSRNRLPDDGTPGEGDNVLPSIEEVDIHPFNYRADREVLPLAGTMSLWDTWVAAGPFDLETRPEVGIQAVAYYDTDGYVRVAARRLGESTWVQTPPLPTLYVKSKDGHRSIQLAFDQDGRLHLASNHHGIGDLDPGVPVEVCCSPIQYFRTPAPVTQPSDILTMVRMPMRSADYDNPIPSEDVATYPIFMKQGERFFFSYRDGWSNGGEFYVNEFDRASQTWRNPNGGVPWFSGVAGLTNPDTTGAYGSFYFDGDRFHIMYATSWYYPTRCSAEAIDSRCNLFYVWTRDFDHFYDVTGAELSTPITPFNWTSATVIDAGSLGGVGWATLRSDGGHGRRPIVGYLKFASTRTNNGVREGSLQAFVASWNGTSWQHQQISDFDLWYPVNTTVDPPGNAGYVPTIISIIGPVEGTDGLEHWYTRATVFESPVVTTGWKEFDHDTLALTPAPDFSPPDGDCNSDAFALPLQYPEWVDVNGARFQRLTKRSNDSIIGLYEEAADYYYLTWDGPTIDPVSDPPPILLSLRRTKCVKR